MNTPFNNEQSAILAGFLEGDYEQLTIDPKVLSSRPSLYRAKGLAPVASLVRQGWLNYKATWVSVSGIGWVGSKKVFEVTMPEKKKALARKLLNLY
jgi:hypothetical protein